MLSQGVNPIPFRYQLLCIRSYLQKPFLIVIYNLLYAALRSLSFIEAQGDWKKVINATMKVVIPGPNRVVLVFDERPSRTKLFRIALACYQRSRRAGSHEGLDDR